MTMREFEINSAHRRSNFKEIKLVRAATEAFHKEMVLPLQRQAA